MVVDELAPLDAVEDVGPPLLLVLALVDEELEASPPVPEPPPLEPLEELVVDAWELVALP